MHAYVHPPYEPIAIIGSGCRFPGGATSPSKLWDLLKSPRDVSKRVPERSFNPDGFHHPDGEHHGASNVTKSYFLEEDPRLFDSVFFNISPREAEAIDPQQRLLLETVYEAMESSGLTLQQLQGSLTSAYVGIMTTDYTDTHARDTEFFSQYQATGTSRALASNRLSYFFDWKGPSMTVDTACSSSLTAIHLALQSLRGGESQVACAAGANLLLGPDLFIGASSLHMISPSGRSQMWDQGADGYARGEGIAAVFLKTLSQALRDGDRIEALVRETGVNSDGRTQGITLPSSEAQTRLIRSTYARAGLDLSCPEHRPQYFEAHGTGTQAGDPREAAAIQNAFFPKREPDGRLLVGSIKTVVGHTEGCAGVAGVLKAVQAMKHKTVPPNQHLKTLNPKVAESYINLEIPVEALPWPTVASDHPLRSSVNSFGFGGTNTHAILETYVPAIHDNGPWGFNKDKHSKKHPVTQGDGHANFDPNFSPIPLVLSANSDKSLLHLARAYANLLGRDETLPLTETMCTLFSRRTLLPHRLAVSGPSRAQLSRALLDKIATAERTTETPGLPLGQHIGNHDDVQPRVLGVFTGQGAQWAQMGRDLLTRSPVFHNTIQELEKSLSLLPDAPTWSLEAELLAPPGVSRLAEAAISQPLCTAVQLALCDVLAEAGISPGSGSRSGFNTVVGHSSGEIAAAAAAGRISRTDAIRIAYYRGVHAKLAQGRAGQLGSMIAVGFGLDDARIFCSSSNMAGRLAVAASNAPTSVTLSGDADAVHEAKALLDARGLFNRVLQVDTAYHSHHMASCADAYVASLLACDIQVSPPRPNCSWVSSVYGSSRVATDDELKASYWRDNMVQTVLFSQAIDAALDLFGPFTFGVEVGPHAALRGPTLQTIKAKLGSDIPYLGALDRKKNDVTAISDLVGALWTHLGPSLVPDLAGYVSCFIPGFRMPPPMEDLPTYPWSHDTVLWRESRLNKQYRLRADPPHELLGVRTTDDTPHEPRWRNLLKLDELPWVSHHRIQDQVIVPGAAYCVMALEAAKLFARSKGLPAGRIELHDVVIERPIALDASSEATETLFSLRESDVSSSSKKHAAIPAAQYAEAQFVLSAGLVEDGVMRRVCHGTIHIATSHADDDEHTMGREQYTHRDNLRPVDIDRFYSTLSDLGYGYSGPFRGLVRASRELHTASGIIARDDSLAQSLSVHPSWLDVSFQTLFAALSAPGDGALWTAFVPNFIRKIAFNTNAGLVQSGESSSYSVEAHVTETQRPSATRLATVVGDISIFNSTTGALEIQVEDMTMSAISPSNAKDDRQLYMRTAWKQDLDAGIEGAHTTENTSDITAHQTVVRACQAVLQKYLHQARTLLQNQAGPFHQQGKKLVNIFEQIRVQSEVDQQSLTQGLTQVAATAKQQFLTGSSAMQLLVAVGDALIGILEGKDVTSECLSCVNGSWSQFLHEAARSQIESQQIETIVSQLVHKHPRARILQVGTEANIDPEIVISQLVAGSTSYTVLLGQGSDEARDLQRKASPTTHLTVTAFDTEKGLHGLPKGSFDLVLLGYQQCLGDAASLLSTEQCRALLKPGGYLVFGNLAYDDPVHTFAVHGLDFINGHTTTQPAGTHAVHHFHLHPLQSQTELHGSLIQQGFSSVGAGFGLRGGNSPVAAAGSEMSSRSSLVLVRAVTPLADVLTAPLQASRTPHYIGDGIRVAVIGGSTSKVAKLLQKMCALMEELTIRATLFMDLSDQRLVGGLSDGQFDAVISFADIEAPVLRDPGHSTWKTLQTMCESVQAILWLSRGAQRGHDPYHTAMLGLWRSIRSENAHLAVQSIDFDDDGSLGDETFIVSSFVRLWLSVTRPELRDESHTFVSEPELLVKDHLVRIPRIVPDSTRNNRHNSKRRTIQDSAPAQPGRLLVVDSMRKTEHNVIHSLAVPMISTLEHRRLHLAIVSTKKRDSLGVALVSPDDSQRGLTAKLTSITSVQELPHLDELVLKEPQLRAFAAAMACRFSAVAIVSMLSAQKTSVIVGASKALVHAIQATLAADEQQRKVVFLTTDTAISQPDGNFPDLDTAAVVVVHVDASTRYVRSRLPRQVDHVLDVSSSVETPRDYVLAREIKWWCPTTILNDRKDLSGNAVASCHLEAPTLDMLLATAIKYATNLLRNASFINHSDGQFFSAITSSDNPPSVMPIAPIASSALLSPDKTYLLFGLTGQVGRSIAQWLVDNGAKHIFLASRNPTKDDIWQAKLMSRYNAHLQVESVDITNRDALESFRMEKLSSCPPIGGIMNGAMVLADGLFSSMTLETMQRVSRPKIEGSRNLDLVFGSNLEASLDFFIMFSSLSAIIGMPSQANYAAANNFMVGLAMQRKARGLPATVVDLGMIIGLGYISRIESGEGANNIVEAALRRQNYMPVSEGDLHEILTEAIVAGQQKRAVGSAVDNGEIITGLERHRASLSEQPGAQAPVWVRDTRFSHLVQIEDAGDSADGASSGKKTLKTEITCAQSVEQLVEILQRYFIAYLVATLKLAEAQIGINVPIVDFGVDSLVAVEIRSWFSSGTGQDVPVLKILGGVTISQVCSLVAGRMSLGGIEDLPAAVDSHVAKPNQQPVGWNESTIKTTSSASPGGSATGTITPSTSVSSEQEDRLSSPAKSG